MRKKLQKFIFKIKPLKYFIKGRSVLNEPTFLKIQEKSRQEISKKPSRTQIINYLLSLNQKTNIYLEIGIRNPDHNFNHINAANKYSVDPGLEFHRNPADFKMTSDDFFRQLSNSEILSNDIKFDVVFIDGLHLAEQVNKDILNSLKYIKDDGFIVLHDCNPPSEWHARENYRYWHTPAKEYWNGTTWKAFLKWRCSPLINSCCIDSDWGVGVLSKKYPIGQHIKSTNPFFEFNHLDKTRNESLNLIDFETFKRIITSSDFPSIPA